MTMNCARQARISVARGWRGRSRSLISALSLMLSKSGVSLSCAVMSFPWYDDYRTIAKFDKRQTMHTLASQDETAAPQATNHPAAPPHPPLHKNKLTGV